MKKYIIPVAIVALVLVFFTCSEKQKKNEEAAVEAATDVALLEAEQPEILPAAKPAPAPVKAECKASTYFEVDQGVFIISFNKEHNAYQVIPAQITEIYVKKEGVFYGCASNCLTVDSGRPFSKNEVFLTQDEAIEAAKKLLKK